MAVNLNVPSYNFSIPWFIYDIMNKQMITSAVIPSDIADRKDIVLTESPVPGMNYQPVQSAGGGNRKITFTLQLIKRNNTVGNVLLLKQMEMLRNQSIGLLNIFSQGQFTPNPKVLYYWGTGSIPLEYFVKKCDATHKQGWTNALGQPQYSEIEFELWLDENSVLYRAEEVFRKVSAMTGMALNLYDMTIGSKTGRKPY